MALDTYWLYTVMHILQTHTCTYIAIRCTTVHEIKTHIAYNCTTHQTTALLAMHHFI